MNRVIKLIDSQCDRYLLEADHYVLGRQWDNEAEHIVVEKPSAEKDSVCEMFVKANGKLVEVIRVYDEPIPVRSILSQYVKVTIGFSFSRIDGYIKNSEFKDFYFLEAIKPEDFVPTEPEGKDRLNFLLNNALVDMRWKEGGHNTLELINADLKVIRELELSGFVQEQADLGETNPQSEKYVQNKSTKHLQNEGADGSSPYATEQFVKDFVPDVDFSAIEQRIENVEQSIPTQTSQLENDGDGTSRFATETFVLENAGSGVSINTSEVVKEGLVYNTLEWTDEDKRSARDLLGSASKSDLDNKIDKVTNDANIQQILSVGVGIGNTNIELLKTASGLTLVGWIPRYMTDGRLAVGTPKSNDDATTKKYVDELFANTSAPTITIVTEVL